MIVIIRSIPILRIKDYSRG